MYSFHFSEKYLSQIPALQVLVNLGFTYLMPEQALSQRGGKQGNVLLDDILRERLKKNNRAMRVLDGKLLNFKVVP